MATYYLGKTSDGRLVSRKSTRSDFTHAAIITPARATMTLPNFSTSREGAIRNFESYWGNRAKCEVVDLRVVDGKEYRAALKSAKEA